MAAHSKGVIMNDKKAAMPHEGAYAIIDWLLKCMQQADDNIVVPMRWSVKDALCCQDEEAWKEAQAASGGVDKEKSPQVRDCSHDSIRRQHYREAWDQDSENKVAWAMSQVHIHSSALESSMPRKPRMAEGLKRRTWKSVARRLWWQLGEARTMTLD